MADESARSGLVRSAHHDQHLNTYGAIDGERPAAQSQADGAAEKRRRCGLVRAAARPVRRGSELQFHYASGADKLLMLLGVLCTILTGCTFIITIIVLGGMIGETMNPDLIQFNMTQRQQDLFVCERMEIMCIKFLVLGLISVGLGVCQTMAFVRSGERQANCMSRALLRAILQKDVHYFDENCGDDVATLFFSDVEKVRESLSEKGGMAVFFLVQAISAIVTSFIYCWWLALIMLSLLPVGLAAKRFAFKRAKRRYNEEQIELGAASSLCWEALAGVKTVQAFCGQSEELRRYDEALRRVRGHAVRKETYTGLGDGAVIACTTTSAGLGMWVGAEQVYAGTIGTADIWVPFLSLSKGFNALAQFNQYLSQVITAIPASNRVLQMIESESTVARPQKKEGVSPVKVGRIEFRDVHFAYAARDVNILSGVSFVVEPGQSVALVGPSGCGKSTIIKLLLGLYKPTSGQIFVDGEDIRSFDETEWRRCIGIVGQEPVLFSATIRENIRIGALDSDCDLHRVTAAARAANAHHFIQELPDRYQTMVGERGAQLSGGQKQRVAIARALVRDPRILLLDEATSALDGQSEMIVQRALADAQVGRTTLIVAHKLSTIHKCDQIIVLSGGHVEQRGTHAELMKAGGTYRDLVATQNFGYPRAPPGRVSSVRAPPLRAAPISRRISTISEDYEAATDFYSMVSFDATSIADSASVYSEVTRRSLRSVDQAERARLREDLSAVNAQPSTLWKIIGMTLPDMPLLVVAVVAALLISISNCMAGLIAGIFVTSFQAIESFEESHRYLLCGILTATAGIMRGCGIAAAYCSFARVSENLGKRLRVNCFEHLLYQDGQFFDSPTHSTAKLATRLSLDAQHAKKAVDTQFGLLLGVIFSTLLAFTIAVIIEWRMIISMIAFLLSTQLTNMIGKASLAKSSAKRAETYRRAGEVVREVIENIHTIRSLACEEYFYEKYCARLEAANASATSWSVRQGISFAVLVSALTVNYSLTFYIGALVIRYGHADATNVIIIVILITISYAGLRAAASYFPDLEKAKCSAGLLKTLLDEQPLVDTASPDGATPEIVGEIVFDAVAFTYPNRPEQAILRGVRLRIEPGQTVAVVGPSGCGKSTLITLLERFYDPSDGSVFVDKADIKTLNVQHLRGNMAIVSQEPILFNRTIAENIRYGMERCTMGMIRQAASEANISEFIESLPLGYDTNVGDRGALLSGGQRQRIAIARAIVRQPSILCLDEATAALDTASEKLVQEALEKSMQNRSCILIAHRLSTVQNSDLIVVLRRGRVAEQGTHNELLERGGLYHSMLQRQRFGDDSETSDQDEAL